MALTTIGLIAAIAAIPLVTNLTVEIYNCAKRVPRNIANSWLESGRCERLLWSDVPSGELHSCGPCTRYGDSYHRFQTPPNRLWKAYIKETFSQAWSAPERQGQYVTKHPKLALDKKYLRVDPKVVLAFALCTAREEDYFGGDRNARIQKTYKIVDLEGVYSCRLEGSIRRNLTKAEAEMLLEGYPP
jgi:hypothetical protein